MTMGEKIKDLRIKKKITQEELASKCNTTKQTIYKYEQGIVTNIPSDKIEIMSEVLGTSPAYLMGWEPKEQPGLNLGGYEALNDENRAMVDRMIAQLLKAQSAD